MIHRGRKHPEVRMSKKYKSRRKEAMVENKVKVGKKFEVCISPSGV